MLVGRLIMLLSSTDIHQQIYITNRSTDSFLDRVKHAIEVILKSEMPIWFENERQFRTRSNTSEREREEKH